MSIGNILRSVPNAIEGFKDILFDGSVKKGKPGEFENKKYSLVVACNIGKAAVVAVAVAVLAPCLFSGAVGMFYGCLALLMLHEAHKILNNVEEAVDGRRCGSPSDHNYTPVTKETLVVDSIVRLILSVNKLMEFKKI